MDPCNVCRNRLFDKHMVSEKSIIIIKNNLSSHLYVKYSFLILLILCNHNFFHDQKKINILI